MSAISTSAEPEHESAHPAGEPVPRHPAGRELVGDLAVADDRPAMSCGKSMQVQRGVHGVLLAVACPRFTSTT